MRDKKSNRVAAGSIKSETKTSLKQRRRTISTVVAVRGIASSGK
ncbi:MAG: hypothetical protein ACI9J2_000817 [Saprospiraceae bacterium]|jgi:hypothetical protein